MHKGDMFGPPTELEITKPTGFEGSLNEKDIAAVAAKYKVSPEELRSLAPYYGAQVEPGSIPEGLGIGLKSAAGLASRTAGLGVLQFAYKKAQDPAMRAAIDELTAIGNKQSSMLDTATELVAPGGLGGAATKLGRLAKAGTMGAVIGTAGSREGEELQGAGTGALLGTGLGIGAEVVGVALNKLATSRAEKQLASKLAANKQAQFDLEEEAAKISSRNSESEEIIKNAGLNRKTDLSPEQARKVLEEQTSPEFIKELEDKQSLLHQTYVSSRVEEATSRKGIGSEMSSLEAERAYLQKKLDKLPKEIDTVPLEKDLIRTRNAIDNSRKELDRINSEYNKLMDNLKYSGDTPSLTRRVSGNLETLQQLKEKEISKLANLRDSEAMLRENIRVGPKGNKEVSSIRQRIMEIDDKYPEVFSKVNNISSPKVPDNLLQQAAKDLIEKRTIDFAEDLVGKRPNSYENALMDVKKFTSRQGSEAVAQRYDQFTDASNMEKAILNQGLKSIDTPGFVGKSINWLSDPQFVLRGLDSKYGIGVEKELSNLNKAYNRNTFASTEFRKGVENIFREAKSSGVDTAIINTDKIYNAMDTGNLAGLSQQEIEILNKFKQYFGGVREFANAKVREKDPGVSPLAIPKRENYVPHMVKSTEELIPILEKKIEEAEKLIGSKLSNLSSGDLVSLIQKEGPVKDLVTVVTLFDNKPIVSGADLASRLKEMMYTRNGNIAMETKARAALERNDVMPQWMRETNLYKLAMKYSDNTLKHLYLRKSIDKLNYQARALEKAGADVEAQYVKNIVRDLMGVRKGTAAEATMQARISMYRKLDQMIEKAGGKDTVAGGKLLAIKAIPEAMQEITRQIYPNLLGYWNVRSVIQNATQGITKTAPELGGKYGYKQLIKSAAQTTMDLPRLVAKSEKLGTIPAQFVKDGQRAIAEGIRRGAVYNISDKALQGMADAGMIMFTKMEQYNRALVLKVAENMAQDLQKGDREAIASLRKFPPYIQREVVRMPEKADEILGKYLNDATMYNYNRASMSEFGRTMGPLFSAFSKWPTATLGEIVQEFRQKGVLKGSLRNAEKFIAPFILLQAVDYAAGERMGDRDSLSDRQKKVMGSNGLSQAAPIGAIGGVLKGEIFTPPAADAFIQTLVNPAMEGDSAKFEKGLGSAVMNFTPGAGLFRFMFDDLPTYISGERPEGTNPLERTVEGARKVLK